MNKRSLCRHHFWLALSLPLYLRLLLLLAIGPVGYAEEAEVQAPRIEFSCLHWDGIPEEKLYYREGEHFHLLELRNGARSETRPLKGMTNFELYAEAVNPGEGEGPFKLLGKVAIPPDVRDVLFYIIADREEEQTRYQLVAMDDSHKAFPRGYFRFVNLSGRELSVEFSGAVRDLAADQIAEMPYKILDGGGTFVPCIIRAAVNEQAAAAENEKGDEQGQEPAGKAKDPDKIIFGTRLFGQPSGRELMIIRPSPMKGSDRLKLKFYTQLIAAPLPLIQ